MEHEQVQQLFSEYFEGDLAAAQRAEVESHLRGCAACQAEYEAFQRAMAPLNKLHKIPAPPDLTSAVPDLIARRSRGRFFGRKPLGERLPLEWLSLVMLLLLGGLYLLLKLAPSLLGAAPR